MAFHPWKSRTGEVQTSLVERLETALAYEGNKLASELLPQVDGNTNDSLGPSHDGISYHLIPLWADCCHRLKVSALQRQ